MAMGIIDCLIVVVIILMDEVLPFVRIAKIRKIETGIISENAMFLRVLFQLSFFKRLTSRH